VSVCARSASARASCSSLSLRMQEVRRCIKWQATSKLYLVRPHQPVSHKQNPSGILGNFGPRGKFASPKHRDSFGGFPGPLPVGVPRDSGASGAF
jgi:hypothetical protein